MIKVLIIGASGQLGQSFQYWAPHFPGYKFLFKDLPEFDLMDQMAVSAYFMETSINIVINCAAYTAVDLAEKEQDLAKKVNTDAVALLCDLSKKHQFKLVHFSTDYVFDGTANAPYREDHPVNPIGVYGKTKAAAEAIIQAAAIDSWIIRTSWLFSPYGKNFVKTIFSLLQNKEKIDVVSDQTGSPTYAMDLAEATLKAIDQNPEFTGVHRYHFSNSGETSWYGLAAEIKKLNHSSCRVNPVTTGDYPTAAARPKYTVLSGEKIKKEFNLTPRSWESALEACLKKIK